MRLFIYRFEALYTISPSLASPALALEMAVEQIATPETPFLTCAHP